MHHLLSYCWYSVVWSCCRSGFFVAWIWDVLVHRATCSQIKDNSWRQPIVCVYLVIAPEPGQAVGVHDAEDFVLWILPANVVLVPAVWQELVDVVPQQSAVCGDKTRKHWVRLYEIKKKISTSGFCTTSVRIFERRSINHKMSVSVHTVTERLCFIKIK